MSSIDITSFTEVKKLDLVREKKINKKLLLSGGLIIAVLDWASVSVFMDSLTGLDIKNTLISLLWLVALFVCHFYGYKYIKSWRLKKQVSKDLISNLRYIVTHNNFYECRTEGNDTRYSYLPSVLYKITENGYEIAWRLDGSRYAEHYRDLEIRLSDLLGMSCNSVDEVAGYVIYSMIDYSTYKPLQAEGVKDYSQFSVDDEKIKLTSSIAWNLRKAPHLLLAGGTGSGKSYMLLYLLRSAVDSHWNVKVIDPKRSDLFKVANSLCVPTAFDLNNSAKLLREAKEVMLQRYKDMAEFEGQGVDYTTLGLSPVIVFIDEAMSLLGTAVTKEDKKVVEEIQRTIQDIIGMGRQAGVNIVYSVLRADTEYTAGGLVRDQYHCRIGLGNMNDTARGMLFGSEFKDITSKFTGKGIGLLFIDDGTFSKPIDFKAPRLDNSIFMVH